MQINRAFLYAGGLRSLGRLAWTADDAHLVRRITSRDAASFPSAISGHDVVTVVFRTAVGLALLPVAASLSQLVMGLHRAVVAGLLCTSEERLLRRQLEDVRRSRSAVLAWKQASSTGSSATCTTAPQQRLVALTIDLGRASEKIDTDPSQARELILEGQEQARQALSEIRSLVRGIAPAILIDRGLVAAIESISGRGPVPTVVLADLQAGERLPPAVERTPYFVVFRSAGQRCQAQRRQSVRGACQRMAGSDSLSQPRALIARSGRRGAR